MLKFDSTALSCDLTLCYRKNRSQRIKGRGDKALILIYFNSPTAEVFPQLFLFFSISAIFRAKRTVKVGPKRLSFGPSLFHKNSNPSKNFQTNFFFCLSTTFGENLSNIGLYLGESRPKQLPARDIGC